jgi:hypothetical protein
MQSRRFRWDNVEDESAFQKMEEEAIQAILKTYSPLESDYISKRQNANQLCEEENHSGSNKEGLTLEIPKVHSDQSCSYLEYGYATYVAVPGLRPCSPGENEINDKAINWIQTMTRLAQDVASAASQVNDATNDCTPIQRARDAYSVPPRKMPIILCAPTYDTFVTLRQGFCNVFNRMLDAQDAGFTKLYANAERELGKLSALSDGVKQARQSFEGSASGGGGVAGINAAHSDFVKQNAVASSFKLEDYFVYDHHSGTLIHKYSAQDFYQRVDGIVKAEIAVSTITELDRLRDEYVTAIPHRQVPSPAEFTQTKHCANFTFTQLNTGDYTWAVLRDVMLTRLDQIANAMNDKHYPIQLNSVYRNPRRSDAAGGRPSSRHQYGDAVDLQVFHWPGHGRPTDKDWHQLARGADRRGSPLIYRTTCSSGRGHVHVDWRGQSALDEEVAQGEFFGKPPGPPL